MAVAFEWDREGWKEIAACFGVAPSTVRRWYAERPGMPVDFLAGRARASSDRLRAWALRSGLVVLAKAS